MGNTVAPFPEKTRQKNPTLQHMYDAFQSNNSAYALEVINSIKDNIGSFDKDSTFVGSIEQHSLIPSNNNNNSDYVLFCCIENLFSLLGFDISNYIRKNNTTIVKPDKWYSYCTVDISNIKPVWLAYLFITYDLVKESTTNWAGVFKQLVLLSNCKLDDKVFGVPVYRLIINSATVSEETNKHLYDVMKNPHMLHYFNEFATVMVNSQHMDFSSLVIRDSTGDYDVITYCIVKDIYHVLDDLLAYNTTTEKLINTKHYLHLLEDTKVTNKVRYIKLLIEKGGQDIFAKKEDASSFQYALSKGSYDSIFYYFKSWNIIKHFNENDDIVCGLLEQKWEEEKLVQLLSRLC